MFCVCAYLLCSFPYLMPLVARSQSMSAFERQKQKQRWAERRHQHESGFVCSRMCSSCRLLQHETGPDGHRRRSRLGLFTCFTLGHVSFGFSLASTRLKQRCQQFCVRLPLLLPLPLPLPLLPLHCCELWIFRQITFVPLLPWNSIFNGRGCDSLRWNKSLFLRPKYAAIFSAYKYFTVNLVMYYVISLKEKKKQQLV